MVTSQLQGWGEHNQNTAPLENTQKINLYKVNKNSHFVSFEAPPPAKLPYFG